MIRSMSWVKKIPVSIIHRRYAHVPVAFNWEDPLDAASLFTEEELAIQETAKSYCQQRLSPRILGMQLEQTTPHVIDGFSYRCL